MTHNLTLKRLIAQAYDVDMRQIRGGPDWIDSTSYDINAKIPAEDSGQRREKIPLMLQSLLADRFHLAIHREPEEISGYALVVVKKGSKMLPAKPADGSSTNSNNNHLVAQNISMESFAKTLSHDRAVGELVVDKTGLSGGFDFELSWSEVDDQPSDLPSIFTALEDRLGLKLESAKIPVEAIVVDRAEKPGAN